MITGVSSYMAEKSGRGIALQKYFILKYHPIDAIII